jgi:hypothetical protein
MYVSFVFENKYYGEIPWLADEIKKKRLGKRKRKYFFFSVFRAIACLALDAPMSRSQLPSVKYV